MAPYEHVTAEEKSTAEARFTLIRYFIAANDYVKELALCETQGTLDDSEIEAKLRGMSDLAEETLAKYRELRGRA